MPLHLCSAQVNMCSYCFGGWPCLLQLVDMGVFLKFWTQLAPSVSIPSKVSGGQMSGLYGLGRRQGMPGHVGTHRSQVISENENYGKNQVKSHGKKLEMSRWALHTYRRWADAGSRCKSQGFIKPKGGGPGKRGTGGAWGGLARP